MSIFTRVSRGSMENSRGARCTTDVVYLRSRQGKNIRSTHELHTEYRSGLAGQKNRAGQVQAKI